MYKYFEDYSNRLCTFNFENWPYRGAQLKPSKLASIGYECKDDGLYCNSCQSKYVVPDPSIPNDVVFKQAYNTHEKNCPELLIQFKISKDFLHVYGLIYYNQCIESQKEAIKLQQTYLEKIPKDFHYLVQDQKKVLAIFGWLKIDQILVCKFCGRKCEIESEEEFDVFGEHRYFCKWANEGKNFKYGYLALLQRLKDLSGEVPKTSEHDTMKVQIMSTLEDLIKASQSKQQEEQKVKESINNFREILNKRKRFSIQEFEKDWENIEAEKKKKIKIQSDLIAQQNSENQQLTVFDNENIQQQLEENNQSNQINQENEQFQNQQDQCQQQLQELALEQIQLQKQLEENSKIIEIEEKIDLENEEKADHIENEQKIDQIESEEKVDQIENQEKVDQIENQEKVDQIENQEKVDQIENEEKQQVKKTEEKEEQLQEVMINYQFIENPTSIELAEQKQGGRTGENLIQPEVPQQINDQNDQDEQEIKQEDKTKQDDQNYEKLEEKQISNQIVQQEDEQQEQQNQQDDQNKDLDKEKEYEQPKLSQQSNEIECEEQQGNSKAVEQVEERQVDGKLDQQTDFQVLQEQQMDIINPLEEEQNIHTKINLEEQLINSSIKNQEDQGENNDILNNSSHQELQEEKNYETQTNDDNQLNEKN